MKKILWGILAAFTTPEAIKAERSLAATVVTRLSVMVPSAGFILVALAHYLGA